MTSEHLQRFAESLREDERREVEAAPAASSTGKAKRKRKTVQEVVDYLNEKSKLEFCGEVYRKAKVKPNQHYQDGLSYGYGMAAKIVASELLTPDESVPSWHDKPMCAGLWAFPPTRFERSYICEIDDEDIELGSCDRPCFGPIPARKGGVK